MKIPKIETSNKIRDAKICMMWARDLKPQKEIAERFSLSITRISTILYKNKEFIQYHKDWEKVKRVYWLKKQIKKRGDSNKDSADLQEQLRKEFEGGDTINIDNSKHFHLTVEKKKENLNRLKALLHK